MGFLKRRKQPHDSRATLPPQHRTAEQRRDGVAPRWQLPDKHCTAEQRAARAAAKPADAPKPAAARKPRKAKAKACPVA